MPEGTEATSAVLSRVAAGFAGALRDVGVAVGTGSVIDFAAALALVGAGRRSAVYYAGRITLVSRSDDFAAYDRAFATFFEGSVSSQTAPSTTPFVALDDGGHGAPISPPAAGTRAVRWSAVEVLRQRDLGSLDDDEWEQAKRAIAALRVSTDLRRSRRLRHAPRRGTKPDLRATVRRSLRTDGLHLERAWRQPSLRPRRLVVVVDVSGSMEPYARACLRFAQAAVAARRFGAVEVFTLGTRLTRVTRQLGVRDAEAALRSASAGIADWSGGTRLGEGLAAFNEQWGIRGLARGAVVVILSDGWDRGDPELLGEEMARLHRVAHRVVWVNPLKASPGYAPLARGMAAALPHVDEFVEGHSLDSLERLAATVGHRGSR